MSSRISENPFLVLELGIECTAAEVESQGEKLLAMLELGLRSVNTYPTPLGAQPRDSEKVRQSMAELRDPFKRLVHEIWAYLGPDDAPARNGPAAAAAAPDTSVPAWPEALEAFGWRPGSPDDEA